MCFRFLVQYFISYHNNFIFYFFGFENIVFFLVCWRCCSPFADTFCWCWCYILFIYCCCWQKQNKINKSNGNVCFNMFFWTFISTFISYEIINGHIHTQFTHTHKKRQQNKLANVKKNSTDERSTTTRNNDIKEQRYLAVESNFILVYLEQATHNKKPTIYLPETDKYCFFVGNITQFTCTIFSTFYPLCLVVIYLVYLANRYPYTHFSTSIENWNNP